MSGSIAVKECRTFQVRPEYKPESKRSANSEWRIMPIIKTFGQNRVDLVLAETN